MIGLALPPRGPCRQTAAAFRGFRWKKLVFNVVSSSNLLSSWRCSFRIADETRRTQTTRLSRSDIRLRIDRIESNQSNLRAAFVYQWSGRWKFGNFEIRTESLILWNKELHKVASSRMRMQLRSARFGNVGNGDWRNRVPRLLFVIFHHSSFPSVSSPSCRVTTSPPWNVRREDSIRRIRSGNQTRLNAPPLC